MSANKINTMLHLDNCIDVMKNLEENSIDLTITSPPYDDIRNYEETLKWDWETFKKVAKGLFKVTKTGGVVVWIVGDATINGSETGNSFKQALYFKECGFNLHDTMIYQKQNPAPTGGHNRYYSSFEYMFILSKGTPCTFNPIMVKRSNKWNDKRKSRSKNYVRNKDGEFNSKQVDLHLDRPVKMKNVWDVPVGGGISASEPFAFEHPAILPEKIAENHVLSWSNENDIIFDPFMGSGTTGKMALKNNRSFVGIEIVEKYYKIAKKRLARFETMHKLITL